MPTRINNHHPYEHHHHQDDTVDVEEEVEEEFNFDSNHSNNNNNGSDTTTGSSTTTNNNTTAGASGFVWLNEHLVLQQPQPQPTTATATVVESNHHHPHHHSYNRTTTTTTPTTTRIIIINNNMNHTNMNNTTGSKNDTTLSESYFESTNIIVQQPSRPTPQKGMEQTTGTQQQPRPYTTGIETQQLLLDVNTVVQPSSRHHHHHQQQQQLLPQSPLGINTNHHTNNRKSTVSRTGTSTRYDTNNHHNINYDNSTTCVPNNIQNRNRNSNQSTTTTGTNGNTSNTTNTNMNTNDLSITYDDNDVALLQTLLPSRWVDENNLHNDNHPNYTSNERTTNESTGSHNNNHNRQSVINHLEPTTIITNTIQHTIHILQQRNRNNNHNHNTICHNRIQGPNEIYYMNTYHTIISNAIQKHHYDDLNHHCSVQYHLPESNNNNNNDDDIREQQQEEQEHQFVTHLFQRLGIIDRSTTSRQGDSSCSSSTTTTSNTDIQQRPPIDGNDIHNNNKENEWVDKKEEEENDSVKQGLPLQSSLSLWKNHDNTDIISPIIAAASTTRKSFHHYINNCQYDRSSSMHGQQQSQQIGMPLFTPIPTTTTTATNDNFDLNTTNNDFSIDLFASPTTTTTTDLVKNTNTLKQNMVCDDTQTKTSSSVEVTRAAARNDDDEYDSPCSFNRNNVRQRQTHLRQYDDDNNNNYKYDTDDDDDDDDNKRYNSKKRDATTSGKRGADMVRLRMDDDINDDIVINVPSPSKFLIYAIDRLSMVVDDNRNDADIFPSSQSPILPPPPEATQKSFFRNNQIPSDNNTNNKSDHPIRRSSCSMDESIEVDDGIFLDNNDSDNSSTTTTITEGSRINHQNRPSTHNGHEYDSLVETTMLRSDKNTNQYKVHWDYDHTLMKDAPTDVRLRDGETIIRYPKLNIASERSIRPMSTATTAITMNPLTQSHPDPLRLYDDKLQQRLHRLYAWILQRDQPTIPQRRQQQKKKTPCCGAVLSVTEQHVTDIVLKLHLDQPLLLDESLGVSSIQDKAGQELRGKTLIITRSKDELEIWRRSFREGSGLSIINHAAMPITQRKHPTCPAKLVHYDIVLSTFDAIKSTDMAVKIDTITGLVVTRKDPTNTGGWYTTTNTTTSQSQQRNGLRDVLEGRNNTICSKVLGAVHKIQWCRLILVDVVGRKGYIIKSDTTARVQAVRALNANTRLAFFVATTDVDETRNATNSNKTVTKTTANRKQVATTIVDGIQQVLYDRNTILSLASTLRHPTATTGHDDDDDNNKVVDIASLRHDIIIDFHQ